MSKRTSRWLVIVVLLLSSYAAVTVQSRKYSELLPAGEVSANFQRQWFKDMLDVLDHRRQHIESCAGSGEVELVNSIDTYNGVVDIYNSEQELWGWQFCADDGTPRSLEYYE